MAQKQTNGAHQPSQALDLFGPAHPPIELILKIEFELVLDIKLVLGWT